MPETTKRQQAIYEFIRKKIGEGKAPTYREIGEQFGIRSPNGVKCHLDALEAKKLIKRDPLISCGIRLTGGVVERLKALYAQATSAEWAEFMSWVKKSPRRIV